MKYALSTVPIRTLDRLGLAPDVGPKVRFVVERGNWSIKWDGQYITEGVNRIAPGTIKAEVHPSFMAKKLLHFGSQFQWLAWSKHVAASNRSICTFFHGKREDDDDMSRHVDSFLASEHRLQKIVTAASVIERRLLSWGVAREKLIRIPIGVDCTLFQPVSELMRLKARQRYGIHPDQIVIGSFQKDGVGWGDGMEPKLIKGPDILLQTVEKVAKRHPVFVILTGPARGYVKAGLDRLGISYTHEFVRDYLDLPKFFSALDVYVNPSREEGGPKGILEAMASGVLVSSTRVGMAEDVIADGVTGLLVDSEDTDALSKAILTSLDTSRRKAIVEAARNRIVDFDWSVIARLHYEQLYLPMFGHEVS